MPGRVLGQASFYQGYSILTITTLRDVHLFGNLAFRGRSADYGLGGYSSRLFRSLLGRTTHSPNSPTKATPPRITSTPICLVSLRLIRAGTSPAPCLFSARHYPGGVLRACYADVNFVLHITTQRNGRGLTFSSTPQEKGPGCSSPLEAARAWNMDENRL